MTFCLCLCLSHSVSYLFNSLTHMRVLVPAVIIIVSASIASSQYGSSENCWLTSSLIWAFLGPVIAVASLNILMFVRIMNVILRLPVHGPDNERRVKAVRGLKVLTRTHALILYLSFSVIVSLFISPSCVTLMTSM